MSRPKQPTSLDKLKALPPQEHPDFGIPTVQTLHLHAGLDLLGSKTTFTARTAFLYEKPHGIMMISKSTKRKVVIPFANIKGYELI